ncbi:hypothetical protein HRbin17_01535 [bacterium HR17]|uniref:Uncharacterized protein n=1 Tax=Candidatus Fervidibacter japonicus TaxID=2035412 RepID=A0A2H5XCW8_9BACT|nr:hypothetical protein HRbin17_01535 [bacterium HR17]
MQAHQRVEQVRTDVRWDRIAPSRDRQGTARSPKQQPKEGPESPKKPKGSGESTERQLDALA